MMLGIELIFQQVASLIYDLSQNKVSGRIILPLNIDGVVSKMMRDITAVINLVLDRVGHRVNSLTLVVPAGDGMIIYPDDLITKRSSSMIATDIILELPVHGCRLTNRIPLSAI